MTRYNFQCSQCEKELFLDISNVTKRILCKECVVYNEVIKQYMVPVSTATEIIEFGHSMFIHAKGLKLKSTVVKKKFDELLRFETDGNETFYHELKVAVYNECKKILAQEKQRREDEQNHKRDLFRAELEYDRNRNRRRLGLDFRGREPDTYTIGSTDDLRTLLGRRRHGPPESELEQKCRIILGLLPENEIKKSEKYLEKNEES